MSLAREAGFGSERAKSHNKEIHAGVEHLVCLKVVAHEPQTPGTIPRPPVFDDFSKNFGFSSNVRGRKGDGGGHPWKIAGARRTLGVFRGEKRPS